MKNILRLVGWNLPFFVAYALFYQVNPYTLKHTTAVVTSNLGIDAFSGETSSDECYLPRLRYDYEVAGQHYSYLLAQLQSFAAGQRVHALFTDPSTTPSAQKQQAIADYLSRLTVPRSGP